MPELIRTVRCNLEVDPQQALILHETMARFAAACQDIHQVALQHKTTNKIAVQHLCYRTIKARYGLQANLVIRAIARVCEAMKPDPEQQRTFRPTSVSLDQRTFRWIPEKESISVSTHAGRLVLPVRIGQYQRELLAGKNPTSATLVYSKRKRHFYIHIVVSTTVPEPHGIRCVGVDRGLKNLATTSDGLVFPGGAILARRRHFRRLRESLQRKGTKGAKRTLRRLSGKERRWMRDVNHTLAKRIVESLKPGDVLVLEDLKYIRQRIQAAKKLRPDFHSWAFGQLQAFLEYKALARGIPVLYVDPRNTSRQCPRCGHISQENRLIQSTFRCQACGFQHHADIVASINIARRAGSPATGCGHTALKARRMTLQGTARGADARAKPPGFSPCGL